VIVAVYVTPGLRSLDGPKVAVSPLYVTVPDTLFPPELTVNVESVIVEESIASEKVAVIAVFTATLVAVLAGVVELTVGAVVSSSDPVVKDQIYSDSRAFPAKSLAPVLMLAVYSISESKFTVGVNVAVVPL